MVLSPAMRNEGSHAKCCCTIDVTRLFEMAGLKKRALIGYNEHTRDNDVLSFKNIRKGWVYGALLAFREYKRLFGRTKAMAVIGVGAGVDSVGAYELLEPSSLICSDIHQAITKSAWKNLSANLPKDAKITMLTGDLCAPLIERGLKVDLIYGNIPNIPVSQMELGGGSSRTFFIDNVDRPKLFKKYLLAHQYSFLRSARSALAPNGSVIAAIGGRVPYDVLIELFRANNFMPRELVSIFKYQTERDEVVSGYAKAENDGVEFDLYLYTETKKIWDKVEGARLTGPELKELFKKYRISAKNAIRRVRKDKSTQFGIVAHYLCGQVRTQ